LKENNFFSVIQLIIAIIENQSFDLGNTQSAEIANAGQFTVFDDSYNASYESVYADLEYMSTFSEFPRSALLGDILELGDKCEQIHRKIGEEAVKHGIERLYLFGNYSEYTRLGALYAGMKDEYIFINSDISRPDLTAEQILNTHRKKEIILFKASHKINLRRIIDLLTEAEGRK
jgi:UDP-N-acetylmuramoyl-tripeptide--D-alanyl-D-alanine ligase